MRRRATLWLAAAPLLIGAAALLLDRAFPLDLTRARTLSAELRDASGRVINLRPAADGAIRLASTADEVGTDIVPLLLAREDRRFWAMPGVDPMALARATAQVVTNGKIVSGGSTIAMQVARLLEPHPRTLVGKLHDIGRAMQLQANLGRSEMLRLYLTLAPMGGNIEGVRAASLLYFGREPATLTRQEAALLIALPQSPTHRRPDRHPEAAWRAAGRVLEAAGDATPVLPERIGRAALLSLARHLAAHLTGRSDTTLDAELQAGVEAMAAREAAWLGPDADVAALVIRNSDRAVLAYLGGTSADRNGSMVDMVRAPRSPGSALKPFIYAMAFDQGLAAPGTVLDDGPLRIGDYAPRDFDRAEHGSVTAAEALRQSLNRPAVRLLSRVGVARFTDALAMAGARLKLPRDGKPSAALALGGSGISLFELASLYADLADGGAIRAVRVSPASDRNQPAGELVSRHAAALVGAILRDQPAPPGITRDPEHPIAYKTGTSYGYRDAWAAGFTPAFTIVVWVGRPDNTSRPGAAGRETAAPLLFRLFALLPPESPIAAQDEVAAPRHRAPALDRSTSRALRILFPPGDVEVAFDRSAPIDLRAIGGAPPYRWTVDGMPLPAIARNTSWIPSGPGFAHLTVADRDGRSASADIRFVEE